MTEFEKRMYVLGLVAAGPKHLKELFEDLVKNTAMHLDGKFRELEATDVTVKSWVRELDEKMFFPRV